MRSLQTKITRYHETERDKNSHGLTHMFLSFRSGIREGWFGCPLRPFTPGGWPKYLSSFIGCEIGAAIAFRIKVNEFSCPEEMSVVFFLSSVLF